MSRNRRILFSWAAIVIGAATPLAAEDAVAPPAEPAAEATTAPAVDPWAPATSPEAIHDELRALRATMEKALNERDLDALVENAHPEVVFTTMNGDVARGRDAVRKYYEKMMVGPEKIVESVDVHFESDALSILYGDAMAIAYGPTHDHYVLTDGSTFEVEARWSATLVRWEGRWVVASFHYSTNMFSNPVLAATRKVLIRIAIGVAIVAVLAGFFLGRRRSSSAA